jgi:hypothetical protein
MSQTASTDQIITIDLIDDTIIAQSIVAVKDFQISPDICDYFMKNDMEVKGRYDLPDTE